MPIFSSMFVKGKIFMNNENSETLLCEKYLKGVVLYIQCMGDIWYCTLYGYCKSVVKKN